MRRRRVGRVGRRSGAAAAAAQRVFIAQAAEAQAAAEAGEDSPGASGGEPSAPTSPSSPSAAGSSGGGPQAPTPAESLPAESATTNPHVNINANHFTSVVQGGLVLDGSSCVHEVFSADAFGGSFDNITVAILHTPDTINPSAVEHLFVLSNTGDTDSTWLRLEPDGAFRSQINGVNLSTNTTHSKANQANWTFYSMKTGSQEFQLAGNDTKSSNKSTNTATYPSGGYDELIIGAYRVNGGALSGFYNGTIHEVVIFSGGFPTWPERRAFYRGERTVEFLQALGRTVYRHWILNASDCQITGNNLVSLAGSPTFSDGSVVYANSENGTDYAGALVSAASDKYHELATLPAGLDLDDYSLTVWVEATGSSQPFALSDGTTSNRDYVTWGSGTTVIFWAWAGGSSTQASHDVTNTQFDDVLPVTITKRAANDREYYVDGASVATITTTRDNASAIDRLQLGTEGQGSGAQVGYYGRVVIHSPALTDSEVLALHNGVDPRSIGTCVAFYTMSGGSASDELGGADIDAKNAATTDATRFMGSTRFAARQLATANQPTFAELPSGIGGADAIEFNGVDQYMEFARSPLVVRPYSVFGIWQPETPGTATVSLSAAQVGGETAERYSMVWLGSGASPSTTGWRLTDGGANTTPVSGSSWVDGSKNITATIHTGTTVTIRLANGELVNGSVSAAPEVTDRCVIGAEIGSGGTLQNYWKGKLGYLQMFPRALSSNEARGREDVMSAIF